MSIENAGENNGRGASRVLCLAGMLLILAGCASKEFSYNTTVSGGEQMKFTFGASGPAHAKAEGFEVLDTALLPDSAEKKMFYGFRLLDAADGKTLQSVRIEDVSDPVPVLLLEEPQPKVNNRIWAGKSRLMGADDPALKWISYVNDSVRVYRFTLTLTDGRKLILHQPSMVPGWMKAGMRSMFGEKY